MHPNNEHSDLNVDFLRPHCCFTFTLTLNTLSKSCTDIFNIKLSLVIPAALTTTVGGAE